MDMTFRTVAAILCVLLPGAAAAEDHAFKRIKVGESQPGKRITVQIDPEEQKAILDKLADASDDEKAFVAEELGKPVDIQSLVAESGDIAREQIYSSSLSAIRVDSEPEKLYLRQLATALQLSDEQRDAIHAKMGVAPLGAA